MDTLHYDEALAYYRKSYDLFPNAALLYNEGRVHQARGEYPEALVALARFDSEAPPELKARAVGLVGLIAEIRSHVGVLDLACNVGGAQVLVRGRIVGTTPFDQPVKLNAGKPAVHVEREGFYPYDREIDLPGDTVTRVSVELKAKERAGVVSIRAPGEPATVSVDGRPSGMTPLELALDSGSHALILRRPGYDDLRTSVVVAAGQRRDVELSLARTKPVYARWWFWAGAGAVVAGGAALTAALLVDRAHGTGTLFSPSVASAP
jgi:tetratricopeptide (TPR) repeat protein